VLKIFQKIEEQPRFALALILLCGLALRMVLMPYRWINPDEGAHLMDARLLLQGLAPLVDFGSKQPFYIALLASAVKVFGAHLWVGRTVVLLCQVLTAWIFYAIANNLISSRAGLLAAAFYSFLPFSIIWAPVVKTEPPAILLATVSIYLFMIAIRKTDRLTLPFFWAGAVAGLAYYVRQSTLFLPLATLLFVLFYRDGSRGFRMAALMIYAAGYLAICTAAVLIYRLWMPFKEIIFSPINPFELIMSRGLHVFGMVPSPYRIVDSSGFRIMDQGVSTTLQAWQDSLLLSLFIPVLLMITFVYKWKTIRNMCRISRFGYLLQWMVVVLAMYVFQSLQRGFFSQYFLEILAPAMLLVSVLLGISFYSSKESGNYWIFAGVLIFFVLMAISRSVKWIQLPVAINYWVALLLLQRVLKNRSWVTWMVGIGFGMALHVFLTLVLLPFFYQILVLLATFYGTVWFTTTERKNATLVYTTVFVFCVTAAYSGSRLSPRYECVWSPKTLQEVSRLLRKENQETTVLAGTTIWAFESGLQPYLNISHPTEVFRNFRQDFSDKFLEQRPDFIILDGYTHRKYSRYWKLIQDEITAHYEKIATFAESNYPVEIYRLTEGPVQIPAAYTYK
jgi:hypothetical protein